MSVLSYLSEFWCKQRKPTMSRVSWPVGVIRRLGTHDYAHVGPISEWDLSSTFRKVPLGGGTYSVVPV